MAPSKPPTVLAATQLRRRLNLYPPYLFNRVRIREISPDFRFCALEVRRSLLTRNLQGTLFGGTIYAAADPIFALLYWQALAHRGHRVQAWVKSATLRFSRPARAMTMRFEITHEQIEAAEAAVAAEGRFSRTHTVVAENEAGEGCAEIASEVVLRRPRTASQARPGF